MKIKSYFAQSMHEAMQRARYELGPDALLISSRKSPDAEASKSYEVTFGLSSESEGVSGRETTAAVDSAIAKQLADLGRQIEGMKRSFAAPLVSPQAAVLDPTLEHLVSAGFSMRFAQDIAQAVQAPKSDELPSEPAPDSEVPCSSKSRAKNNASRKRNVRKLCRSFGPYSGAAVLAEVEKRLSVAPELGKNDAERKIVLVVGPPGSGKTTTLVKLAITYGVLRKMPIQVITTDTVRLGGSEQLQAYARIIGASFRCVTNRTSVEQTIDETPVQSLVLIDTPGFSPAEMEEAADLCAFAERCDVDVHLVLPASLNSAALSSALTRFGSFRPSKLLFTHLDEVGMPVCAIEAAATSGLPISFWGNGQQIPDDLAEGSKDDLCTQLAALLNQSKLVVAA